jgi:WD40 repeat protein
VWEAQTARLVAQLIGHTSFVDAVTFSPDGRQVLTASRDGTARLWNALTGAPQAQLLGHHGRVTSATFTTDGSSAVTSGEDGTARTWSVHSDPQLRTVADGPSPITDIGTTVDGTVVVEGRRDGTVTVRSADGRPVVEVQLAEPVTSVALSPDGRNVLATGAEGAIGVWTANGSTVALLRQSGSVTAGVFLPDGRAVITAAADGLVRSWDLATQRAKIVAREKAPVADVAVDPEGVSIATAVGDIARVRPLGRRGRAVDFVGHRDALTSVSFSSDGARLLTTSFDHDAAIWDARTGRRTKTLVGHVAVVRGAAFSADGRWIATAGPTRAGLWESRASSLVDSRLYYVSGHRGAIAAVVFAGSGWRIFSGGSDGTLRRYDCRLCTDTEGLRRIAARKLARLEDDKKR